MQILSLRKDIGNVSFSVNSHYSGVMVVDNNNVDSQKVKDIVGWKSPRCRQVSDGLSLNQLYPLQVSEEKQPLSLTNLKF